MPEPGNLQALGSLDQLTRRLRRECPWDRQQDERSIVAHTLEEAYELADMLFQIHFLALLMEERGAGDLGRVAEHCESKLIRRHPHIFAQTEVADAEEVLRNWDQIKAGESGREQGTFGEVPENLPALLYARKIQRRAISAGAHTGEGAQRSLEALGESLQELRDTLAREQPGELLPAGEGARPEAFKRLGELLFVVVALARELKLDPELALRAATHRFREQIGET
jgi:uncharacterized protein YabN with tetrapyrrole methylase and pyrophosphatase domain